MYTIISNGHAGHLWCLIILFFPIHLCGEEFMHLFILLYNFLLKYSSFTVCKCTSKWFSCTYIYKGFPGGTLAKKKPTCQCRRYQRLGFVPWVRKIPWCRKWQPSPVFLPGKFHGQKILAGYSPWGRKELNTAEHTHTHTHTYIHIHTFFFRFFPSWVTTRCWV